MQLFCQMSDLWCSCPHPWDLSGKYCVSQPCLFVSNYKLYDPDEYWIGVPMNLILRWIRRGIISIDIGTGNRSPYAPASLGRKVICVLPSHVKHSEGVGDYLGRHENQQLPLFVLIGRLAEQSPQSGDITQQRHLGDIRLDSLLIDTTQHQGLAIIDQHLSGDGLGINGYCRASRRIDSLSLGILSDGQIENYPIIRGDLRRDFQAQYRLLESDRGGATGRGLYIGDSRYPAQSEPVSGWQ